MSYFDDVVEFQQKILNKPQPVPTLLDAEDEVYQEACLIEELTELREALSEQDLVGAADALADLIYFALGFAYRMGLPFNEIWAAVHQANMTKCRGLTHRGVEDDAAKPAEWVDPKTVIKELLK